jgi:hypothetical protein
MEEWKLRRFKLKQQEIQNARNSSPAPHKLSNHERHAIEEYKKAVSVWKDSAKLNAFKESKAIDDNNDIKKKIIDIYKIYNPEKLSTIDNIFKNYEGKEDKLLLSIQEKYINSKESLQFPKIAGETCVYIDFTIDGTYIGRAYFNLFTTNTPMTAENFRCLCTGEKV